MREIPAFRRGDVVPVRVPFVTNPGQVKRRPAVVIQVVIQNDVGNRFSPNLIIATISSQLPRREYPTSFVVRRDSSEARGAGLEHDSVVQAENILTIPKGYVVQRLGAFNNIAMRRIDECLKVSLALR